MLVAQLAKAGAPFELVERPIPTPGPGQVLIKVESCGVCHSDAVFKDGHWPGMKYPFVPGHEVIGRVEKIGPGVQVFKAGQRVGVGWNGGYCQHCEPCRSGDFPYCTSGATTAVAFDGGYGEYMVAPETAVAAAPDGIDATVAGPLMCAGVTTYNALRKSGACSGDLVAVQGIGGLGHLAVQFAARSGYRTVAISRGKDKEKFARELGAHEYIDDANGDAAAQLQKLGGAQVILATAPNSKAISALAGGLKYKGKLVIIAASFDNVEVSPLWLLMGSREVAGHYSGYAKDSEDTLKFSVMTGVKPLVEVYPLAKVNEAYARMLSNQARFRVVLKM
ncbi:MAG TPA: alcohol dehydrogenase [Candidatus Methylacidiphilales bacterium]|jgi:alcohol dehydrogenase/propanol-preferring alcohol dehydrogenase|nr:alcohol dehydrogenase [Candidatus Methylacidiphilales bacterium]